MSVPCLKRMNTRDMPVNETLVTRSMPRIVPNSSSSGMVTLSITSRAGESVHGTATHRNGSE